MFKQMREDIAAIRERDPAAQSNFEVWWLYNGYKALRSHRRANWLLRHGHPLLARWVSQRCVRRTNIEIHPAAVIGKRFFIDHGTGVVIGETTEIGDDCTLYQGVTLGGTGKDQGKRHPTIGNNVLLSTGSKVLGPFKVGDGARIAANAVVLKEVPEDATAVGVPARVVRIAGEKTNFVGDVDQVSVPDPVQKELDAINSRLSWLEEYLDKKHEEEENKRKEKQQDEAV